jgi:hypothetical protein
MKKLRKWRAKSRQTVKIVEAPKRFGRVLGLDEVAA